MKTNTDFVIDGSDNATTYLNRYILDIVYKDIEKHGEHSCTPARYKQLLQAGLDKTYEFVPGGTSTDKFPGADQYIVGKIIKRF